MRTPHFNHSGPASRRLAWAAVLAALVALLAAACSPETLAVATRDGNELELVDARGQITQDGTTLEIAITGWSNPSCRAMDDEVSVTATLRIPDVDAVPLGVPVDVARADAPIEAVLSMGSMGAYCGTGCEDPVFSMSGTVTLTALSPTRACGSLDLRLDGDIPRSGAPNTAYQRDSSLTLVWEDFCAPMHVDHCE